MKPVRPKKNLGQHFLTDLPTARRIADTVDVCPGLPVLEVGPGMGVMTQYLLPKPREVKVVEIDRESVSYLRERWPELQERIVSADFLRMDLREVFAGQEFVLTGNYPYDISSQIFFHMLDFRELIPCCTGMVQLEMAQRIAARPGTKAYGILSVLLQMWYDVELLFQVPPTVFNPPPKVQSAVVCMRRNTRREAGCDEQLLRRIVKGTFQQRRKMLRVSLRPLLGQLYPNRDFSALLASPELTRRPEQLSVEDFIQLARCLHLSSKCAEESCEMP
ncbi:MAG: 16S rRNA (adenine(1518)-N(6)/adenine(1519)-N(6))-dimethyltransferase RsmA [Alloprevotella sp.]|nr:16S rRNA (adenine(1518)-N(6)/adenine(1519)-N(6))-dimethyltransferase RsmA [Alloprevotella sp.]